MGAIGRWIVGHPRRVVALNLALTAIFAVIAARVRIESSLESVLPSGDPEIAYYEQVRAQFGGDDVGVIGVRADDLFSPSTLAKIARVTTAVSRLAGVESVLSITNAKDIAADVVSPPPLLPRLPPTPEDVAALRAKLEAVPLYRENLVAPDWRGAAINVVFEPLTGTRYADLRLDEEIAAILAEVEGPEQWYYTGAEHVKRAAVDLMRQDLLRFTPLALLAIVFSLWVSFRTKRGVALPVLAVSMALVWTVGVLVATGRAIGLGTFVLPPLLLVVGASYAIHVMARYYEAAEAGGDGRAVTLRGLQRVALPLAISAVVTTTGFGALMVNRIPAIWELGAFSALGVVCLTIVCLTFLPATLSLLPVERVAVRARDGSPALEWTLGRLARYVACSRPWVAAAAGLLALLAIVGMWRIEVDSDFLLYFSPRSEVRRANEVINAQIVGSNPFYVVVEAPRIGGIREWQTLRYIDDLQRFLVTLPGITSSISIVDYLELLEAGLLSGQGGDLLVDEAGNIVPAEAPRRFWDDPSQLERVLGMVAATPETFGAVVTPDFRMASVLVRTRLSGSREIERTLAAIREYIAGHFPAEYPVRLTGDLVLMTGTTSEVVRGQVESLGLAFSLIFLVLAAMFLSLRIGALAILPNVLPILVFFGLMGWLGIMLNVGTSLIATIALGIAVDSTVHYMARLNRELRGETDQEAAIRRALVTVGQPIVYTTVALVLGFLVFALSSFVPIQSFGVLASVTLAAGLGANLVVLPALLSTVRIITLWDLVGVKLGRDPTHEIPLFAGLRPSQARVVVLMGEVRRFAPGEAIVRQGEAADAMYVMLSGRSAVWATGADGARRHILDLRRGDVLGEMGLVRGSERSADVIAATDVEVLAVDERFLQRIQRRYPRIASKVFLNLARILSDRLERTTSRFVATRAATAAPTP